MKDRNSSAGAIVFELERLKQLGTVLYIGAHPDDENTELLAYLAKGRKYRTAYLSLTRGDGGQNLLGPELGEKLGLARTEELLAARQVDGARQFFSSAVDFGFSKDYAETLRIWNKDEVLADMVRTIREFRPDIIITRFSPEPGGTHGHHTASAVLALEAFKLAGDKTAFPEQGLAVWQPHRILWNVSRFQQDKADGKRGFKIESTGIDQLSGEPLLEIAQKSRAMHKTQGFDKFRFQDQNNGQRFESFIYLDGARAGTDIMEGVDCSWKRIAGAEKIPLMIDSIIDDFKANDPAASTPALLKLKQAMHKLRAIDPLIAEKESDLDQILSDSIGLRVETKIPRYDYLAGEKVEIAGKAQQESSYPLVWKAICLPDGNQERLDLELKAGQLQTINSTWTLPSDAALSHPYWLSAADKNGHSGKTDFEVKHLFELDGQPLWLSGQLLSSSQQASEKESARTLAVIPPVSLRFLKEVMLFAPGQSKTVDLELRASRPHTKGKLSLSLPPGWSCSPEKVDFELTAAGEQKRFRFELTAPDRAVRDQLSALAEVGGKKYSRAVQELNYQHIPKRLIQPLSQLKLLSLDLNVRGKNILYIAGAGDSLAENLEEMGYCVKVCRDAKLSAADLEGIDAVVLGVRALNVQDRISESMPLLFEYVNKGGTLLLQYNRPDKLKAAKFSPFEMQISPARVTDENCPVEFIDAKSPLLNKPNKISQEDFKGWVQERGLYFPDKWDEHFQALISCCDKGEAPQKGAILWAKYGKGYYIYTSLSFFRQLPAAVPGAYRLFANLVSIGK